MPSSFPANTYPNMIVTTSGIVHYMRFGDSNVNTSGDDADGLSGFGANCGSGGSALAGDSNASRYFNGSSSYISFGNTNALTGTFTVEVWVYPSTNYTSGFPTFLSKENWNSPASGWSFFLQGRTAGNGGMRAAFSILGSLGVKTVYSDAVPVNAWTHLAATFDGSTLRMYQNGVLKWDTPGGSMYTSAYNFLAGAASNASLTYYSDWYHGHLDELAIYNRALSATELTNHYNRALTAPNTNTYLTTSDSDKMTESSTRTQSSTMTLSETRTLTGTETYAAQRGYIGTDSDTITSTDVINGIVTEFAGDKLSFADSPTWGRTTAFSTSSTVPLADSVQMVEDVPIFGISSVTTTHQDSATLSINEEFAAYNIIDSRYHGKIHRERLGLLNKAVHQRYVDAEYIQFPHDVSVRIGIPEDDYFVVQNKDGQLVGLGRMITTWDGPRYASRPLTVHEDVYVAASNAHTTIELYKNPYDHPDILTQFGLPVQAIG